MAHIVYHVITNTFSEWDVWIFSHRGHSFVEGEIGVIAFVEGEEDLNQRTRARAIDASHRRANDSTLRRVVSTSPWKKDCAGNSPLQSQVTLRVGVQLLLYCYFINGQLGAKQFCPAGVYRCAHVRITWSTLVCDDLKWVKLRSVLFSETPWRCLVITCFARELDTHVVYHWLPNVNITHPVVAAKTPA